MIHEVLEIGPHVTALPVVHGSGDFAWEVRRLMMKHDYDCLAVALPASFQAAVQQAIMDLPTPSVILQQSETFSTPNFKPQSEFDPNADTNQMQMKIPKMISAAQTTTDRRPVTCRLTPANRSSRRCGLRWAIASRAILSTSKPATTCRTRERCLMRLR